MERGLRRDLLPAGGKAPGLSGGAPDRAAPRGRPEARINGKAGSGAAVFQNGQSGGGAYPPPLSVFRRRCFRRPPDRRIGLYALMTVRSDA